MGEQKYIPKFQAGMLCKVKPHANGDIAPGSIVQLIKYVGYYTGRSSRDGEEYGCANCWEVDGPNGTAYCNESILEPFYDGNEKSSWDECVWRPKAYVILLP
jgi:hypothetical protein